LSTTNPETDQVWSIELNGINPISDAERHGRPFELFWVWFASNVGILGVVYGAILFSLGLNLWQSIFVALVASALSFALVGILSVAGVRGGAPMLTLSRAAFGPRGNFAPTLISWISLVGWETVLTITAAYAMLGLLNILGLPTNALFTVISLVIVAALIVVLGLLGHATLIWIERFSTWLFGILTLLIVIFLIGKTNWSVVLAMKPGSWNTGVLAALSIVAAGTGIGWVNSGADYTRYLPRRSSGGSIVWWTVFGGTLPLLVLMIVGVLLSSRVPNLASSANPIQLIGQALPSWFAIPYLITAVGGLIAAADLDIYSSGLNLLALGLKAERYKTVLIDGVIMIAGSIYVMLISQNFLGSFESFLELLADGLAAWSAIFLVDMLWRRYYDPAALADTSSSSRYFYIGGFNIWAFVGWLVGFIISLLFTVTSVFTGPFAIGIFAGSSLGFVLGFAASAIIYGISRFFVPRPESVMEDAAM
jgi:NCS1 family nucleobase:cation symporter-1